MQLTQRKRRFRRLGYFVVGLFFAYILGCYFLADLVISRHSTTVPVKPRELVDWEPIPGLPTWSTVSVANGGGKFLFVFVHGLKGDRSFYEETALELVRRGYDVLLLPLPGHDANPDGKLGFGPKEANLIKSVLDKTHARYTVLVGCSMGGAACWMASDHPAVSGIVTEGAFSHLDPVTRVWFDRKMPGGSILLRPVIWIASSMVHVNPADVNPVETARRWDQSKPALVIQGTEDKLIPMSQGRELAEASGAEYWEVPGQSHAQCQKCGGEYVNRVERVMQKIIANWYSVDHDIPGGTPSPPNDIERRAMRAMGKSIRADEK